MAANSRQDLQSMNPSSSTASSISLSACVSDLFLPPDGFDPAADSDEEEPKPPQAEVKWDVAPRSSASTKPSVGRFRIPNFLDKNPSLQFTTKYLLGWKNRQLARATEAKLRAEKKTRGTKRKRDSKEDGPSTVNSILRNGSIPISDKMMNAVDWNMSFQSQGLSPLNLPVKSLPKPEDYL